MVQFLHERIATERTLFGWRSRSCKCLGGIEHQAIHMSWILAAALQLSYLQKVPFPCHCHLIPSGPTDPSGRILASSANFFPNHTGNDGVSSLLRSAKIRPKCGMDARAGEVRGEQGTGIEHPAALQGVRGRGRRRAYYMAAPTYVSALAGQRCVSRMLSRA